MATLLKAYASTIKTVRWSPVGATYGNGFRYGICDALWRGKRERQDKESTITLDMVNEEKLDIGPKMYLDSARVYTKFCHVTADNELVNSPSSELSMNTIRFRHYYGTCGQPIPLVTPFGTLPPFATGRHSSG
ncbi:uncharacterized protein LOC124274968 [Haliotis rubra]|uniref:uncharacterized protein LOC124274968 n=1 Tax=Haliotis rubra TaxID=36100 RepID=UPI001EE5EF77|nr:uncharacterized protein LOC124274968 [Haliotis rubra]